MADTEYGLQFSEPKIVMTRMGERTVRNAEPTEAFWQAWRDDKLAVKAAGYSLSKDYHSGQWTVALWAQAMKKEERDEARAASHATDADVELPRPDGLEYLPYQKAGIRYAAGRERTLIADDMGLGKTIQAIGVANVTQAQRILVICPAVVLYNWQREIAKWQTMDRPITVLRSGTPFPIIDAAHVVIINYDILNRYEAELRIRPWDLLIVDEAHYLKNGKAQRTKQVFGRREDAKRIDGQIVQIPALPPIPAVRCVLLTGTPILNRPQEIWSLIHYCDPKRWRSFWSFATRYCGAVRTRFGTDYLGPRNLDELQARLRDTIMVRRLKHEVLTELPPKRRQIIPLPVNGAVELIKRELETYDRIEAARAQLELAAAGHGSYADAVAALKEAEKIGFTELARIRAELALAKAPHLIEHLSNIEDGKVVVFAHHKTLIAALMDALKDQGVVCITGDTPPQAREEAVKKFQTDPSIRFFVGSLYAAGVGITLTESSHVVFGELDWVPGTLSQAEDRCHRIGQRNSVFVQHLVFDGSLDAKMAKVVVAKQEVITAALDKETEVDLTGGDYIPPVQAPQIAQVAVNDKRAKMDALAASMSDTQRAAAHRGIVLLNDLNADMASQQNMAGFNKMDTLIGASLAAEQKLSPRQAALAHKILRKYRRQLPADLYSTLYGD
jgi:SWI/SNF-related matrix-associated actin-dependent regulator 1 of chromatin subfamily A